MKRYLSMEQCTPRHVYELRARNLTLGVYAPPGFIGLRTKFESTFLFTEYHFDMPGTAAPLRELGVLPSPHIRLWEYYPQVYCQWCGEIVEHKRKGDDPYRALVPPYHRHITKTTPPCDYPQGSMREYAPLHNALRDFQEELDNGS